MRAIERAARKTNETDFIELRLDCLSEEEFERATCDPVAPLRRLIAESARPIILTLRGDAQGGKRKMSGEARDLFWKKSSSLLDAGRFAAQNLADIELDLLEQAGDDTALAASSFNPNRTICSHHDFNGVPSDLEQIYERATRTGAHVIKIAVQTDDALDGIPVMRLLRRARSEGRVMIAVAMGEGGIWTRLLAASRGAYLTYAALDKEQRTAPGQITIDELRDLYRINTLSEQTEITGLVGSPIAHSLSPYLHNRAFAACGYDAVYIPFKVHDIGEFIRRMAHPRTREIDWRLRGLSVTAPHKQTIIPHLHWIDAAAREIGAVNTICVEDDKLCGYNTDADAVLAPLRDVIGLRGVRVAVIGAGGAARAVLWSLGRAGASATVFARNAERARAIAQKFDARVAELKSACFGDFELVINATPLGTHGQFESETPATVDQLRGARLVYDLVYNPVKTAFLREARKAGCAIVECGGLAMLITQAARQFKLWTGQDAPDEVMSQAAEEYLSNIEH